MTTIKQQYPKTNTKTAPNNNIIITITIKQYQ